MTQLWPRLPFGKAIEAFADEVPVDPEKVRLTSANQEFGATGGNRVGESEIGDLRSELTLCASNFGYPQAASSTDRIAFDRSAAFVLTRHMEMSWSEASTREVWNFLALVPLERLTEWRFGRTNRERWIASDLTRHTWARLWWQGTIFAAAPDLLAQLSESDLNQLLERRAIGGDQRLTVALAEAVVHATADGDGRRAVIRDATARVRRRLAFTETSAMSASGLELLCAALVDESLHGAGADSTTT